MIISVDAFMVAAIVIIGTTVVAQRYTTHLTHGQRRLYGEMRKLTQLNRAELDFLLGASDGGRTAECTASHNVDEQIETIIREIEAGPYVRDHVRPDLPPEVGVLHFTTPDGPVTVTSARWPRTAGQRRTMVRVHG